MFKTRRCLFLYIVQMYITIDNLSKYYLSKLCTITCHEICNIRLYTGEMYLTSSIITQLTQPLHLFLMQIVTFIFQNIYPQILLSIVHNLELYKRTSLLHYVHHFCQQNLFWFVIQSFFESAAEIKVHTYKEMMFYI